MIAMIRMRREYAQKGKHALLKVKTETLPSEEAHARIAPSSCGAQETELTEMI